MHARLPGAHGRDMLAGRHGAGSRLPDESMPRPSPSLDRPRTTTEILDAAFAVLRADYGTFLLVTLVALAPAVLLHLWWGDVLGVVTMRLADALFGTVADAAVIVLAASWIEGRATDAGGALRRAARRMPALVAVSIVVNAITIIGYVLLIVPGLLVQANLFASPVALLVEDLGVDAAMSRSSELAQGHLRRLIGALVVTLVVSLVGRIALGAVFGAAVGTLGGTEAMGEAAGILGGALLAPFAPIVVTLLYFDLRLRKEAYDLERMVAALPPAAAAP